MSMQTYITYGYGICISEVTPQGEDRINRLKELLSRAPKYQNSMQAWFDECGIKNPCWDDYLEFDQDYDLGLATILQEVIEEVEGLRLVACKDYEDEQYLLFVPLYPWQIRDEERDLTEDRIREIITRYTCMLVDKPVSVDYQQAEIFG